MDSPGKSRTCSLSQGFVLERREGRKQRGPALEKPLKGGMGDRGGETRRSITRTETLQLRMETRPLSLLKCPRVESLELDYCKD